MFLATTNKPQRLVHLCFIGRVTVEELRSGYADMSTMLKDFPVELRILADFERMESLGQGCREEIARNMEMFDQHGVEIVVRVIPDESKDFGLNIMTVFHYRRRPRIVTCRTMLEAGRALDL